MRKLLQTRRGMTAVLAMMYLMLFSVLALGFFATVSSSAQISGNDKRGIDARLAAESGMQFMKYHLAEMNIPRYTSEAQLMDAVYTALSDELDGTTNMRGQVVTMSAAADKVFVPGPDDTYIRVDDNSNQEFRATIKKVGRYGLRVTIVGRANGVTTADVRGGRGVQIDFSNKLEPSPVFAYGVASRGTVGLEGQVQFTGPAGSLDLASILSASTSLTPITVSGSAGVSGDVTTLGPLPVVGPSAKVGNVAPTDPSYLSHVKTVAEAPEFPAVDTTDFVQFAPPAGSVGTGVITTAAPASGTYRNIRIRAGTNPTFNNATLEGVVVVEYPNRVTFGGTTNIRGTIVSECIPSDQNHEARVQTDMADGVFNNYLDFGGTVNTYAMSTLDPTVFTDAQRALTGSLIIAPGFKGIFRGSYTALGGAIVTSAQSWEGNAGGNLNASVISLSDIPMTFKGNQTLNITGHGFGNPPGLRFTSHFAPVVYSYREVRP